jgi:hypothetical protein
MTKPEVVILDYNDLIQKNLNLSELIVKAFGNTQDCLGVCFVRNVPNLQTLRSRLLKAASALAHLSTEELDAITHPQSYYNLGWSHGSLD